MKRFIHLVVCTLLLLAAPWSTAAERDVGLVVLHGKWDSPPTHVLALSRQLEAAGYRVTAPTLPWSGTRLYDVPYGKALEEIDAAAASLRAKGASRIVVVGLSLGGNAALAYAASGRPLDGVVVLSPGHTPERGVFRKAVEASVAKAQDMVNGGRGAESASFDDRNQGRSRAIRTTAQNYLSYFDPEGAGNMQKSAAAIPASLPVFMAVGTADPIAPMAEESIYLRAPKHEKSRYVSVAADHLGIVTVIPDTLIAWLRSLDD